MVVVDGVVEYVIVGVDIEDVGLAVSIIFLTLETVTIVVILKTFTE